MFGLSLLTGINLDVSAMDASERRRNILSPIHDDHARAFVRFCDHNVIASF